MSSEPPAAKRQRTENAPEVTRSETWRDDGNVVLQAGNVQFRAHWSVLALHSSVFSDMRGLPQPPDQPTVEGCPVIELFDDSADVEYLLKALYIPSFHCKKVLPLPVIGALLRLGRKYDIKYLFDSAVARLTSEFPATLQELDIAMSSNRKVENIRGYATMTSCNLIFDIITLAHENQIFTVLPLAYYLAAVYKPRALFEINDNDEGNPRLPPIHLRRCISGRESLITKQLLPSYVFGWVTKWEFKDCTTVAACRHFRESFLTACLQERALLALNAEWTAARLCQNCSGHAEKLISAGREKIWNELPEIFDLPPWNELKNGDL
ncbi:BTB domain-containing protein [Favolaschia claudopus]|uniref:BTB domain-containing protein n=1 Tax=Favolaschia claudopus TaxID=2862362 RepID=A0AAW0BFR6_9AGAR